MSLDPGPDRPGGGDPAPIGRRTNKVVLPNYTEDTALTALADFWNGSSSFGTSPRWETVKHLRAFLHRRCAPPNTPSEIPLKSDYHRTWTNNSLAYVLSEIKVAKPGALHLNFDWFGPAGASFWGPDVDGQPFEQLLAQELLNYLEKSIDLKGTSTCDPASWDWPNGQVVTEALTIGDLMNQSVSPQPAFQVRLRWEWPFPKFNPRQDGTDFLIETPRPTRPPAY